MLKMDIIQGVSLCRICLEEGATCPIFEKKENKKSIYSKLSQCLKQMIEDIKGYPNKICLECLDTLNKFCDFMQRLKESHKILESGLLHVKQDDDYDSTENESDNDLAKVEAELKTIKSDPKTIFETLDDTNQPIKLLEPLPDVNEDYITKNESLEKHEKPKINNTSNKGNNNYTNNEAADSTSEEEFVETGDKSLQSTQLKVPKEDNLKGKRRTRSKKAVIQSKLCDICGDVLKTRDSLSFHQKNSHCTNPIQCPQCSRKYSSEFNLNRHIKRKHGSKEFVCASCGHSFAFKDELTKHIKVVHTTKKRKIYSCQYCDKQYKCEKSVLIHVRSVHTGERPAECSVCSKRFYHEDYLKEHMRVHTGEVPFKCPVCGRGYAQRCNMRSHLKIHRISDIDSKILSKMRPNYIKLLKV